MGEFHVRKNRRSDMGTPISLREQNGKNTKIAGQ